MSETEKTFKRQLPVALTDEELIKKGKKSGELAEKVEKQQAEMKAAGSGYKDEIKTLQAQIRGIQRDLKTGTEERAVECVERKDYTKKKASVIRLDTQEAIETRPLMYEELQETLRTLPSVKDATADSSPLTEDDDPFNPPILAVPKKRGRPRKEASA